MPGISFVERSAYIHRVLNFSLCVPFSKGPSTSFNTLSTP